MSQPKKMPPLDLPKQIEDLLQGRSLEQLTEDERTEYYHLTAPLTNGTMSEITDAKEHDSAVRQNMAGNHVGQGVPTVKTPKRLFWNGPERDYGKAMFDESTWEDMDILAVIPRYQSANSLHIRSPWELVIYEGRGKHGQMEIGMFTTKEYRSHSLKFGYKLDFNEVRPQLREGGYIPKDQVIGRNNACSAEGDFQYAHECNVLFTTDSEVSEDQYKISTDVMDNFRFYLYADPLIKYSKHEVALDLYGRGDAYQPIPLPGQYVRPDGLLMGFRKKGSISGWLDYTRRGLREIYDASDRKIHLDQSLIGYGKVIDVEVFRGTKRNARSTLEGTSDVLDTLANMNEDYYGRVVQAYKELRRRNRNSALPLSHELAKYIHDAMLIAKHTEYVTDPVIKQYADRTPTTVDSTDIDDYAIKFTIVAEKSPFTGDKFSDTHGTKGIAATPTPKEHMPRVTLPNGTVISADFALSWLTVAKRMNAGQMYAFEISYVKEWVLDSLIPAYKEGNWKHCWNEIIKLYRCVSGYAADAIESTLTDDTRKQTHVDICMNKGLVFFNPNHEKTLWEAKVKKAYEAFPYVTKLPVEFVGKDGTPKVSKMLGKVASKAMVIIEKHPEVIASGASLRQHWGQPATVTRENRNHHQIKRQSVRGMSETEGQAWLGATGQVFPAETFDRTTNIVTNEHVVDNIINAVCPTNVDNLVDRAAIPLGSAKTIALLNNTINAWGWALVDSEEYKG